MNNQINFKRLLSWLGAHRLGAKLSASGTNRICSKEDANARHWGHLEALIVVLTSLLFANVASAETPPVPVVLPNGTILQDQFSGAGVFGTPYPGEGQTFTAVVPSIETIGVGLQVGNPQFSAFTSVTMSLYAGEGTTGLLLASRTLTPTPPVEVRAMIWLDFDFSEVSLVPGNVYSFSVTAPNIYWLGEENQFAFPNGT